MVSREAVADVKEREFLQVAAVHVPKGYEIDNSARIFLVVSRWGEFRHSRF
jgi:hypothetical protein